ncbi:hypothetical protein [Clostridium saccharoperbutylacetonicum]|uniref:hypothetical protein n=1 Tax=Clostridium saccharoperbutylacetonicum TaxID=36745 RepID=UPI000983E43A|nr:hypothetical protein [Clostridium saccharoperbutylacetonicum]AQR93101.1 hypothetical protein CLSAP_03760 [Clostridium saccharoperbutylacetonicum]NSB34511.1 hypothetical protein [Clostridium saccharoperbutylacetonicum]
MSKAENNGIKPQQKNYKRFSLDSRLQFIKYLNKLICQVLRQLDKYKKYEQELEDIINEHILLDKDDNLVSAKNINAYEYESIDAKLHNVSMELVKIIGDNTNDSASYLKFRRMLEKNTIELPFNQLSEEIQSYLKDVNDLRNWMFHNPESLYVSEEEYAKASIPADFRPYVTMSFRSSPIIILSPEEYSIEMAFSLLKHSTKRIEVFDKILANMVNDYELILGKRLDIQYKKIPLRTLDDDSTDIVQLSYAIQKKKYKGREEDIKNIWKLDI